MAENIYRFEFVDNTSQNQKIDSGIKDTLGSGAKQKADKPKDESKETFSGEFTKKVQEDSLQNFLISPLNTATGGLASPVASTIKRIAGGGSIGQSLGTLGATFGIMAIQKGLQALQNRMTELQTKIDSLGNEDNLLIRAGSVSKATYYSANITGIKKKTNRS